MEQTSHLTPVVGTLLTWHTDEDIQAVRLGDDTEVLYVDGKRIALPENYVHPSQQVINYCMCRLKREKKELRKMWAKYATAE